MSYTIEISDNQRPPKIVVVGCGGTGGFVAEGICRLLANSDLDLLLVDYDRVELHNLRRQNFFQEDMGKFKSQALAERLARHYGRPVGYSVYPYDRDLINEAGSIGIRQVPSIIIGCVDNSAARRSIAETLQMGDYWLDSGNGFNSGQVLFGNTTRLESMASSFDEASQIVSHLPAPSLQLPALLLEPTKIETRQQDCAEAVENEEQSPIINQMMATLVLEFMDRLLKNKLSWMGAYIDMELGKLQTVPAEPDIVARMFGIEVDSLMTSSCSRGMYYNPQRR